MCRGCGAPTQARNGKGDAYEHCKVCHPGAIQKHWSRERVLEAMGEWLDRYGRLPSSYDWSRTRARRRGGEALRRLEAGEWPPASVVSSAFGSWTAAREAAAASADRAPHADSLAATDMQLSAALEPEPAVRLERLGAVRADGTVALCVDGIAGIGLDV